MFAKGRTTAIMAVMGLLLVAGCGEAPRQTEPSNRAAATGTPRSTPVAANASAATTTSPIVAVPAAAFRGGNYEPPHLENGFTLLKHFGVTSATVTLPRDASKVSFRAKTRLTPGEALPVLDIMLEAQPASLGKVYVLFPGETVSKDETFTTATRIPAGTYRVQLGYVRHTKLGEPDVVRPHVEFYGVTFE